VELSSNLDVLGAILQICLIDLLLSGDNAIVIAMACATLPAEVRPRAVLLGTGAAVFFRLVLTFVATLMLRAPYLKLVGAGLLLLIAIELMAGEAHGGRTGARQATGSGVWRAVAIIVVADAVMSLDNVVAVAAAAQDNVLYLLLGLLISVPILVFSSLFVARLLDTYPLIVDAGAALLGWIAGKIAVSDPAVAGSLATQSFGLVAAAPLLGALYVLVQGRRLRRERSALPARAAPQPGMPAPRSPILIEPASPATAQRVAAARADPVAARSATALAQTLVGDGAASTFEKPPITEQSAAVPAVAPAVSPAPAAGSAPAMSPARPVAPMPDSVLGPAVTGPAAPGGSAGGTDAAADNPPSIGEELASAIPELDMPRRFSKMDLTIMGGVAVPLLGLIAMIIYFLVHAASARH